jgi:hypothetical protein
LSSLVALILALLPEPCILIPETALTPDP